MSVQGLQVIEIPCGQGGLNASNSFGNYPITDLATAEGLTFVDDTWQKEGGATKINTTVITSAPTIVGLADYWPEATTQKRIAATSDGKIVTVVTGGIGETLKTGLGTNKQTVFVESLGASTTRKLFSFNGYDAPQVTATGTGSTADLATPPADWSGTNQPAAATTHNNRMWAWGNANFPHTLYYSTATDHEDFTGTGSGTLRVYPGEGERIVAAATFKGRLYVWKFPTGLYWVDDSDATASNWFCKRLTRAVGMAGPLGLAAIENDIAFLSAQGFVHVLTAVQEWGDAKSSAVLPEKIGNYVRNYANFNRLNRAVAVYYGAAKEWHCAFTRLGFTVNNARLVLDLHDIANPKYRVTTRDTPEAMSLTRDSNGIDKPMIGDNAGFVRMLDQTGRNVDGAAFTAKYETGDIDLFPKGIRRANLDSVEVIFKPQGDHNLTLEIWLDGIYSETVNVSMAGNVGVGLGTFVLGTSPLGGGTVLNTRKRITGDGRRVKLIGTNSGTNQNFSIASHLIRFTPGSDRG